VYYQWRARAVPALYYQRRKAPQTPNLTLDLNSTLTPREPVRLADATPDAAAELSSPSVMTSLRKVMSGATRCRILRPQTVPGHLFTPGGEVHRGRLWQPLRQPTGRPSRAAQALPVRRSV